MSHDDILDSMSLSDDDMLDSLADDMLEEMNSTSTEEHIPTIQPTRAAPAAAPMPMMANPFMSMPGGSNGAPMPDLSQMMSQMMPMMSQMFGGAAGGAGNPMFGNPMMQQGRGNAAIQVPWDEVIRQHVPKDEQDDWIKTMQNDAKAMQANRSVYSNPHSRSYRTNSNPLPNVYMEVETLLGSVLNESVRAAHCDSNTKWREYHENLVSHVTRTGLAKVFERELKQQLADRVRNDPDFKAQRDRFPNITKALAV